MKINRAVGVLGALTLGTGLTLAFAPSAARAGGPDPGFVVQDVANPVGEGDVGSAPPPLQTITFTLHADIAPAEDCELVVHTENGTAQASQDFQGFSQTLLIPAGTNDVDVVVNVLGDTVYEPTESFWLVATPGIHSDPASCLIADDRGEGTIADDDPPGLLTLTMEADQIVCESALPTGTITATLHLNRQLAPGETLDFDLETANQQAGPQDYTAQSEHHSLVAGDGPDITLEVPILDDFIHENIESFDVNLINIVYSGPYPHTLIDDHQTVYIKDDDVAGNSVWIDDAQVTEGTGGANTHLLFTVHSAFPAICDGLVVWYHTEDDSPTLGAATGGGTDYVSQTDYIVIPAGDTEATIDVEVIPDSEIELDETMRVVIDGPTGITGDLSATGTIVDDDFPTLSICDDEVVEGTGGTNNLYFWVKLSDQTPWGITVYYHTENGSATSPSDYTGTVWSSIYIPPFSNGGNIVVPVVTDSTPENNENMYVVVDQADHTLPGDTEAEGTIFNDDDWIVNGISRVVNEGDAVDGTHSELVTLQLNAPAPTMGFQVDWETEDGPAPDATGDLDYDSDDGTAYFNSGQSSTTVSVGIIGDDTPEDDENFTIDLFNPQVQTIQTCWGGCFNLVVGKDAVVTIIDDDPEDLPETGFDMVPLELTGFGLLGAGMLLAFGSRRRRASAS